jgi:hypothetical protein
MVGVIRSLVNEDELMVRKISGRAQVDGPQVESWTGGELIPTAGEERIISIVKLAKREERVLL